MVAAGPARDQLLVTVWEGSAYVHVLGRGSFRISTTLKRFGLAAAGAGCRRVVMDLAECGGMDSTFMGVVAGLSLRLRQRGEGEVLLVNLSSRLRDLLTTLGLDQVVKTHMAGATPSDVQAVLASCRPLADAAEPSDSRREVVKTMLEAHQHLVDLKPENRPKFKDVLTFLREDLEKDEPGRANSG
jgi:anti-anti-sigma factor